MHDPEQISLHEGDRGALHRDVRAGAHGDPDGSLRQRGGVVDPIPRHGDHVILFLEPLHDSRLVFGQHLRMHLLDSEPTRDGVGHCLRITSDHRYAHAEAVEQLDSLSGFRANLVFYTDADFSQLAALLSAEVPTATLRPDTSPRTPFPLSA